MFNFAARRAARKHAQEQHKLDCLRYDNADDQLMQLHCDRMQVALDSIR